MIISSYRVEEEDRLRKATFLSTVSHSSSVCVQYIIASHTLLASSTSDDFEKNLVLLV